VIELGNENVAITVSADGLRVTVTDCRRHGAWRFGPDARVIRLADETSMALPPGVAARAGPGVIETTHHVAGGRVVFLWGLERDHVTLTLEPRLGEASPVRAVALPGRAAADGATPLEVLVPSYQGALVRYAGETWQKRVGRGGHGAASMGMAAYLARDAGLLISPDDIVDWTLTFGDGADGPYAFFDAAPCAVDGWRATTVRLCPCGPTVTAAAKRYRALARRRGQWVSWDDKIAAKPRLEKLFGALMTFIGYVGDPETDYVECVRRLRAFGFASLFVYPVRFAHYSQDFTMAGGRRPIRLDDATLRELKAPGGVHLAPWAWSIEGIDDGSARMHEVFRRGRDGGLSGGWRMDGARWQHVCTPYQVAFIRERLAGEMSAMDWLHFDVNASMMPTPCFRRDHALHGNRPLPSRAEADEVRRLFGVDTVGDRVVSSEGFNDAYTAAYDIGSTKVLPLPEERPRAMPVPLTMLVYHDCCIQDWWELHNYNENPCWTAGATHTGAHTLGVACSGQPRRKAALDALYGLPPNVFPFGYQYGWKDRACGETFGFRMALDDPGVREALAAALPVARLHKDVGKLELTDFEFLSDDRFVQRTTFADGTRVVANLGPRAAHADGLGRVEADSWRRA